MSNNNDLFKDSEAILAVLGCRNKRGQILTPQLTPLGINFFFSDVIIWNINHRVYRQYKEMMDGFNDSSKTYDRYDLFNAILRNYKIIFCWDRFVDMDDLPPYHPNPPEGWIKYKNWTKEHYGDLTLNPIKNNILIKYPKLNIMMIGYFGKNRPAFHLSNALEALGNKCIRVASDLIYTDNQEVDAAICTNAYMAGQQPHEIKAWRIGFPVKRLIEQYHPDLIFLHQNDLCLDFKDVEIPVIYWVTEIIWRWWPLNVKNCYFVYAYNGAVSYYQNTHLHEMATLKGPPLFLTYAVEPTEFMDRTPWEDRPNFIGWMGHTGQEADPWDCETDYIEAHVYDHRASFVKLLKIMEVLTIKKYSGYTNKIPYMLFMNQCKMALNVGTFGGVNERQFQAMAMGCVLLQYYYNHIEDLGYSDTINCLLFRNAPELVEKVHWAQNHPELLQHIAEKGKELASQHTYLDRAKQLLLYIAQNNIVERP
jgi:hypothetical protein